MYPWSFSKVGMMKRDVNEVRLTEAEWMMIRSAERGEICRLGLEREVVELLTYSLPESLGM